MRVCISRPLPVLRWHEVTVPLSRRASALAVLLLVMLLGVAAPASAADPRSPSGSWSAATPSVIDTAELATLEIREPGAQRAYDRDAFGPAWEAGASERTDEERLQYANDPLVLLAVDAGANRSKSDQTISEWEPTNESVACQYGASWVEVAATYNLSISPADHETLTALAEQCH